MRTNLLKVDELKRELEAKRAKRDSVRDALAAARSTGAATIARWHTAALARRSLRSGSGPRAAVATLARRPSRSGGGPNSSSTATYDSQTD